MLSSAVAEEGKEEEEEEEEEERSAAAFYAAELSQQIEGIEASPSPQTQPTPLHRPLSSSLSRLSSAD